MVSRNLYSLYRPWCRVIYIAYTGRGVEKFILCFLFLFFQKNNTYYQRIEYSCLRKPVVFASLPEHILCYCLPSSKICFINVSEEPVTDFLYRPQGRAYFGYRFRFNVFSFPWLLLFFSRAILCLFCFVISIPHNLGAENNIVNNSCNTVLLWRGFVFICLCSFFIVPLMRLISIVPNLYPL